MKSTKKSRRDFLGATSGLAVAACAPALIGAENKSGTRPEVIGVEGHRYEVHHDCM